MYVLYDEWVDTRGFCPKNLFSIRGVQYHFSDIVEQIKKSVWDIFTDLKPESHHTFYYLQLVREFYASYVILYNHYKYKPPLENQPWLPSVLFIGVKVLCFELVINTIYFACDYAPKITSKKWVLGGHAYFPCLAHTIKKGLPPWVNDIRQIKKRDLYSQAKHWIVFMSNLFLLYTNDQDVTIEMTIIIR